MKKTTKERLLSVIKTVVKIDDYQKEDYIFSSKYSINAINMVYILLRLEKEFNFVIDDDFVDSLELCTFYRLESILEQYEISI